MRLCLSLVMILSFCFCFGCGTKTKTVQPDKTSLINDQVSSTETPEYIKSKTKLRKTPKYDNFATIVFPPVHFPIEFKSKKEGVIRNTFLSVSAACYLEEDSKSVPLIINYDISLFSGRKGLVRAQDKENKELKVRSAAKDGIYLYSITVSPMYLYSNKDLEVVITCYFDDGEVINIEIPKYYLQGIKEYLDENKIIHFFEGK